VPQVDQEQPSAALIVVEGRNWAMNEPVLRSMCEYLSGRVLAGPPVQARAAQTRTGSNTPVSIVPLKGVITPQPSALSMLFGLPGGGGLSTFMADMRAAVGDPETRAIVIDIDSPGGLVDLVPEAAAEVRDMRDNGGKPIVAVANTVAGSAAYWLASQAHEIVVTPSGEVGSVGVFTVHRDLSEAFAREGVKHTLVKAGNRKLDGNPYEGLSDDAQSSLQEDVNDHYAMFVRDVAAGRGVDVPKLDGQAFGGGRSYLGLADRVATLGDTVKRMASGHARVKQSQPVSYSKDQRLRVLDALTSR
jgi:signal peptide peptidase SppA